MRAGRLDRRIRIERKTVSLGPYGDQIETWVSIAGTRWAAVAPVRGDERFSAPQLNAQEQVEFRVRWSQAIEDVSPVDRIIFPLPRSGDDETGRQIYDVLSVHEIGRREGLRIIAARRVDDPTELTREMRWGSTPLAWNNAHLIWL